MTPPHNVEAFDADGRSVSIIQETATPFDTPRLIARLRLKRKLSKLYAELSQELQSNLSLTEAIKDGQVTSV